MKLLGGLLIVLVGGWSGAAPVWRLRRQQRILEALISALELMRAELRSSMRPLPELCAGLAAALEGTVGDFFGALSEAMAREPLASPLQLMRRLTPMLGLGPREQGVLLELGSALGCYDLESQLRMLDAAQARLGQAAAHCGKRILGEGRGWGVLGLCTGLALAIVLV